MWKTWWGGQMYGFFVPLVFKTVFSPIVAFKKKTILDFSLTGWQFNLYEENSYLGQTKTCRSWTSGNHGCFLRMLNLNKVWLLKVKKVVWFLTFQILSTTSFLIDCKNGQHCKSLFYNQVFGAEIPFVSPKWSKHL